MKYLTLSSRNRNIMVTAVVLIAILILMLSKETYLFLNKGSSWIEPESFTRLDLILGKSDENIAYAFPTYLINWHFIIVVK